MPDEKKLVWIKLAITFLTAVVVILIAIPFGKYFWIAQQSQRQSHTKILSEIPSKLPEPEAIKAPSLSTIFSQAAPGLNQELSGSDGQQIGQIVVPKVSVNQPIFAGLTNNNLIHGTVDLFSNRTPDKNTLTIIGHHVLNYSWGNWLLFGGIEDLSKSDPVYLRYLNRYYEYQVESKRVIKATDLDAVKDQGPDYLYLVTCNQAVETDYRVLVTAKRVESQPERLKQLFEDNLNQTQKSNHKRFILWFILPLLLFVVMITAFLTYIWRI